MIVNILKGTKHSWLKSATDYFYHISSALRGKLSSKMSVLVIYKILGLFVNTLTADEKYSVDKRKKLTNSPYFRTPFDSQHNEGSETLLKCAAQHVYQIFLSLWEKLSWKMSLFFISRILALFFITLTADGKYSLHERENLLLPIQMQLSKRPSFFFA